MLFLVLGMLTVAAGSMAAGSGSGSPDAKRLEGRWLRPDGGYILQLSNPGPGGTLQAAYFNPRPINVGRAEWRKGEEGLGVFVELRDVNYPGSSYTLRYDLKGDRLVGTYFQAVEKLTYDIEFVRKP
jgi:hypothetical protein